MKKLSNVSLDEFRSAMKSFGLTLVRVKGGHEMWAKDGMQRPVVIQTHIDPLPEFEVRNNIAAAGISKKDFLDMLENL